MGEFDCIGKIFIIIGIVIALVGVIILYGSKFNLFSLPGDFTFEGKGWKIFLPFGSSVLISIILTVIFWLISKFFK